MAFLSGSFGPTRNYPEVLQWVADVLPLTYLIRLIKDVYLRGESSSSGIRRRSRSCVAWGVAGVARRAAPLRLGAAREVMSLPAADLRDALVRALGDPRRVADGDSERDLHAARLLVPPAAPPRRRRLSDVDRRRRRGARARGRAPDPGDAVRGRDRASRGT